MARILIATGRDGAARMREILKPPHQLLFATTIVEALEAAKTCDLLVCGLEFDESRMFDFLRQLSEDSELREKPRVCVRFFATNTPDTVIGGLELAARAVGAAGLVDLPALEEQFGHDAANQKVKDEIESNFTDSRL